MVNTQLSSGAWPDIGAYGGVNYGIIDNIYKIAKVYAANIPGNANYNNATYRSAIIKGLNYWHDINWTYTPNWWVNEIYWPQRIGEILIILNQHSPDPLSSTDQTYINSTNYLKKYHSEPNQINARGDGGNMLDIGTHYLYRGILTGDYTLMLETKNFIENRIGVRQLGTAGIKADFSFQEHGDQYMNWSYGLVYFVGVVSIAKNYKDTFCEFDIPKENFSYGIKGLIGTMRGQYVDFNTIGRGIGNNTLVGAHSFWKDLKVLDPSNAEIYENTIQRASGTQSPSYNVTPSNTHFYLSDVMAHSRDDYYISTRSSSTRIAEIEWGNGQNTKGNFAAYGNMCLMLNGNEYDDIYDYWDWKKIPGITTREDTEFPNRPAWGGAYGETNFVGGVSDGLYGASTLDQSDYEVIAKKSIFYFDEEIVFLGAGISSTSGDVVTTTVNNCFGDGHSFVAKNNNRSEDRIRPTAKTHTYSNLNWIRHDSVAYFFPEKSSYKLRYETKTPNNKSPRDIFKLWIEHGKNPTNASYSYSIVPNITSRSEAVAYNQGNTTIISNTAQLQAIKHNSLDIILAIFHSAGTLTHSGTTISVSKPCALMLKGDVIHVSDPTQKIRNLINVSIQLPRTTIEKGDVYVSSGKSTKRNVNSLKPLATDRATNSDYDFKGIALGNFDNDDFGEFAVYGTDENRVVIFDSDGSWKKDFTYTSDEPFNGITSGNFDADSNDEIAVCKENKILIFESDGTLIKSTSYGGYPFQGITAVDIDGDGTDEIAVYRRYGDSSAILNRVVVFESDGSHKSEFVLPYGYDILGITSGNFDDDIKEELAIYRSYGDGNPLTNNRIVIIDSDGKGKGSFTIGTTSFKGIAAGDFDNDQIAELAVSIGNRIKIINSKGELLSEFGYGGYSFEGITSGHFSNTDTSEEIAIYRQYGDNSPIINRLVVFDPPIDDQYYTGRVLRTTKKENIDLKNVKITAPFTFKNPVGNMLKIYSNEIYTISLYDINGRQVMDDKKLSGNQSVDMTLIPDGLYFIQYRNQNKSQTKKIVVKK